MLLDFCYGSIGEDILTIRQPGCNNICIFAFRCDTILLAKINLILQVCRILHINELTEILIKLFRILSTKKFVCFVCKFLHTK